MMCIILGLQNKVKVQVRDMHTHPCVIDTIYLINRFMDMEHQIILPNRWYQEHDDINHA